MNGAVVSQFDRSADAVVPTRAWMICSRRSGLSLLMTYLSTNILQAQISVGYVYRLYYYSYILGSKIGGGAAFREYRLLSWATDVNVASTNGFLATSSVSRECVPSARVPIGIDQGRNEWPTKSFEMRYRRPLRMQIVH